MKNEDYNIYFKKSSIEKYFFFIAIYILFTNDKCIRIYFVNLIILI